MSVVNDIRLAAQLLVKDRWFTLAAASAPALGIMRSPDHGAIN